MNSPYLNRTHRSEQQGTLETLSSRMRFKEDRMEFVRILLEMADREIRHILDGVPSSETNGSAEDLARDAHEGLECLQERLDSLIANELTPCERYLNRWLKDGKR